MTGNAAALASAVALFWGASAFAGNRPALALAVRYACLFAACGIAYLVWRAALA